MNLTTGALPGDSQKVARLRVAALQMVSTPRVGENLRVAAARLLDSLITIKDQQ